MFWFIFSEVMFFAAFFGALWYIRNIALPGINAGATNEILWAGGDFQWPLFETPDQAANGDDAKFVGPHHDMGWPGFDMGALMKWLPLWNTIILLSSSVTVHIAHEYLKHDKKGAFNLWLGITVVLALIFLGVQYFEYYEAYAHMGLKLTSGAYGTTFFMLTGFHGFHVCMGMFMLAVMLCRSVFKGHFSHKECFGFEAASWYWHFVDVVWLGLFIFVYILG